MALTKVIGDGLASSGLPAGTILQTLQASKSDTQEMSSTSFVDVSDLSVAITPRSTSSKILVTVILYGYAGHYVGKASIMRDSTEIGKADAASSRPITALPFSLPPNTDGSITHASAQILDAPSTASQIIYKVTAAKRADGGESLYINRSESDRNNSSYDPRAVSYITVQEVAG
jgi:hypothetical protein